MFDLETSYRYLVLWKIIMPKPKLAKLLCAFNFVWLISCDSNAFSNEKQDGKLSCPIGQAWEKDGKLLIIVQGPISEEGAGYAQLEEIDAIVGQERNPARIRQKWGDCETDK